MKTSKDFSFYGSLAFQLVNNALDLIPDGLEKDVIKDDDWDPNMQATASYDQSDLTATSQGLRQSTCWLSSGPNCPVICRREPHPFEHTTINGLPTPGKDNG